MRGFVAGRSGDRRIYSTNQAPDLLDLRNFDPESSCGVLVQWMNFSYQGTDMVVIRLARGGAKKRPFFNIVVADSRTRRDGRFIERLGFYNPVASGGEQPLRIAFDRVEHWTGTGAQMSSTVARLVAQAKSAV